MHPFGSTTTRTPPPGAGGRAPADTGIGTDARSRLESARLRRADSMAVASFVLGLAGLLVFNLVLGPLALVLGSLALLRDTRRRFRATLGLVLGAADLIVLAVLTAVQGTAIWHVTAL
ncbi:DUF4190 domain-containing protein [Streptomyces sp. URMC 123]|uniref:DUF4190 domain-containing protein n=1 Tax=Streptomyces sp. URMC 123 TaxID=3423403 RepID=UPI003F1A9E3B